jgi:hypothetical protein
MEWMDVPRISPNHAYFLISFSVDPWSIGVGISNFDPSEIGIGATALHVAAVRGHEE